MRENIRNSIILFTSMLILACKNTARYPIDEKPLTKIDTNLLGIWKVVGDTDKKNYILVQNNFDVNHNLSEYKSGHYKLYDNYYYITRMDNAGRNPHYQQWSAYLSTIKNCSFFNIVNPNLNSCVFVRLISVSEDHKKITTATVADTTLKYLNSSSDVRRRVSAKINEPLFYSDTLHLYKVSGFHATINESKLRAN